MRLLLDMNISPAWVPVLREAGHEALHWSGQGAADAADDTIMAFARDGNYVVFTHDLDFGTLLAMSGARKPSILQLRSADLRPQTHKETVLRVLQLAEADFDRGVIAVLEGKRLRLRRLPLGAGQ